MKEKFNIFTIKRSTKALDAIKLIKKFFNQQEVINLVTSNFYSILNYNSEIWQLPSLKVTRKQNLLSASAKALKICVRLADRETSFINLHVMCKHATPLQMMRYKLAFCLFKLYNLDYNSIEFLYLNFNQVLTGRQLKFKCIKDNKSKVGLNTPTNRFHTINDLIPLNWLNMSNETYKVHCKKLFLDFNLDYEKIYDDNYAHKLLFEDFENALSVFDLVQVVDSVSWSRLVGLTLRTSTLDHIYIKDPTVIKDLKSFKPIRPRWLSGIMSMATLHHLNI